MNNYCLTEEEYQVIEEAIEMAQLTCLEAEEARSRIIYHLSQGLSIDAAIEQASWELYQ